MTIGIGIFLIAVGAVLTFAVETSVEGININTVGVILMIVGAVGVLLDLIILMPRRRTARSVEQTDGYGTRTVDREIIE